MIAFLLPILTAAVGFYLGRRTRLGQFLKPQDKP